MQLSAYTIIVRYFQLYAYFILKNEFMDGTVKLQLKIKPQTCLKTFM